MLLNKKSAKEAWEAIKTMRLDADCVKEVNAQKLLAEFEAMAFKPGETIDDFAIRITKLVTDLHGLGEESVTDTRMVKKFLRVVLPRYSQVAVAIELTKELKTLTIEELVGHLRAAEERLEPSVELVTEKTSKLLLTEEEWVERNKLRMVSESSMSGTKGNGGGGNYGKKEKHWKRKNTGGRDGRNPDTGAPCRKGKCCKCGEYGHWGKECKNKVKKERQEAAHHANVDDDKGALLVAQVCNVVRTSGVAVQQVFLN